MTELASELDYCPSCGRWVESVEEETGWCRECSPNSDPRCAVCGEHSPLYGSTVCLACKNERWLAKHTDDLEFLIVYKGYSFSRARLTVTNMIRPICKICKEPVKGGKPGITLFCRTKPKCKSAQRKYRRLRDAGKKHEDALKEVIPS